MGTLWVYSTFPYCGCLHRWHGQFSVVKRVDLTVTCVECWCPGLTSCVWNIAATVIVLASGQWELLVIFICLFPLQYAHLSWLAPIVNKCSIVRFTCPCSIHVKRRIHMDQNCNWNATLWLDLPLFASSPSVQHYRLVFCGATQSAVLLPSWSFTESIMPHVSATSLMRMTDVLKDTLRHHCKPSRYKRHLEGVAFEHAPALCAGLRCIRVCF